MKHFLLWTSVLACSAVIGSLLFLNVSAETGTWSTQSGTTLSGNTHSGTNNSGSTSSGTTATGTSNSGASNSGSSTSGSTLTWATQSGHSHSGMSYSGMTRGQRVALCMRSIDRNKYRADHRNIHDAYKKALNDARNGTGSVRSGSTYSGKLDDHERGNDDHGKNKNSHWDDDSNDDRNMNRIDRDAMRQARDEYRSSLRNLLKKMQEDRRACVRMQ